MIFASEFIFRARKAANFSRKTWYDVTVKKRIITGNERKQKYMEHMYPGIIEPFQEVIGNLITLPKKLPRPFVLSGCKAHTDGLFPLTEKEENLRAREKALTAKAQALDEKEKQLNERFDAGRIHTVPIAHILPSPTAPRRAFDDLSLFSLAESIRANGILQPLTVRRLEVTVTDHGEERYELIAGERRLRAACAAHLETVPCIVLCADDRRAAELALIENLQRENLNMFEEAGAISALLDMHAMTREEIAKSLSRSLSSVANKLRLLHLTQTERDIILSCHLSERHARAFLRVKDLNARLQAILHTAEAHLSVTATEDYIEGVIFGEYTECAAPGGAAPEGAVQKNSTPCEKHPDPVLLPPRGKPVIRDLGLFINTVDRAVAVLCAAGIAAERQQTEENGATVIRISIPHP